MIKSLVDLRPGDIGFTNIGGLIPGVFPVKLGQLAIGESTRIGRRSFDHVLICVEPLFGLKEGRSARAVQAMPRGAEEIALTPGKHWNASTTWFRLPEDYPGQAEDAAAIARLFVSEKVPYSFLSYLYLGLWVRGVREGKPGRDPVGHWLEERINRRQEPAGNGYVSHKTGSRLAPWLPTESICSVLVDQAWTLAGKSVMRGTKPQIVTPGALGARLINDPAVLRGGLGLL